MKVQNYLMSKTTQKFVDYYGGVIRLNKATPYTVDEVIIGKKGKPFGKITTFRDSLGRITERAFNINGKPLKNRIYSYNDGIVGDREYVGVKTVKEFSLERKLVDVYKEYQKQRANLGIRTTLWNKDKVQTDFIAENIYNGQKTVSIATIENLKNLEGDHYHELKEFPQIVNGKIKKRNPKMISFVVDKNNDVIDNLVVADNAKAPQNDSFLGFRMMDLEDFKVSITQRFLRDRNINYLDYSINTDYLTKDFSETLMGLFTNGEILFNKLYPFNSKAQFASTSRHEVEHGWQFFLDARNGGKRGEYMEHLGCLYGPIENKKLQKEANNYTKSLDTYVSNEVDYKRYRKNYIEIRANKAGAIAKKAYLDQGQEIRNEFKHIPKEFL